MAGARPTGQQELDPHRRMPSVQRLGDGEATEKLAGAAAAVEGDKKNEGAASEHDGSCVGAKAAVGNAVWNPICSSAAFAAGTPGITGTEVLSYL
jgi:hypothetical protein